MPAQGHDQLLVDAAKRCSVKSPNLKGGSGHQIPVIPRHDRPKAVLQFPRIPAAKQSLAAYVTLVSEGLLCSHRGTGIC